MDWRVGLVFVVILLVVACLRTCWFNCRPKSMAGGFDGCSFTSECARCGRRILQDSQGGWFPVSAPTSETPGEP